MSRDDPLRLTSVRQAMVDWLENAVQHARAMKAEAMEAGVKPSAYEPFRRALHEVVIARECLTSCIVDEAIEKPDQGEPQA